jgi:NAD(P)-dependent dehydrogenase (short-subunit alcohol dehydrogenase family)
MYEPKIVLVTGASSGVGRATAQLLSRSGYRVFGTSRDPTRAEPLEGVEMMQLDVRSDTSVASCVSAILEKAGHLDVLFNNAGYELAGALEEVSVEEAKDQFETNFFGVHRMVRAVLPRMRQQGSGWVLNMSSLAGLTTVPFLGMYSASKFALEGYTEALRMELQPFGIFVSQIEVGFLNTPMKIHRQQAGERFAEYDGARENAYGVFLRAEEQGPGADVVAETVLRILRSRRPRLRYSVGQQARMTIRLRQFLPERLYERGIRSAFRLDLPPVVPQEERR